MISKPLPEDSMPDSQAFLIKILIAVIGSLVTAAIVQSVSGLIWAAKMDQRVSDLEGVRGKYERQLSDLDKENRALPLLTSNLDGLRVQFREARDSIDKRFDSLGSKLDGLQHQLSEQGFQRRQGGPN